MASQLKVRIQGLVAPELAEEVTRRAAEGRRAVSREVEYLLALGLQATEEQEGGKA